jgi:hypothetical protein
MLSFTRSQSTSFVSILPFVLPLVSIPCLFRVTRLLSREIRDLVDHFLRGLRSIQLSHITFSSSAAIFSLLTTRFHLPTVESLVLVHSRVRLHQNESEAAMLDRLSEDDLRCEIGPFPVGILASMSSLRFLRVESVSNKKVRAFNRFRTFVYVFLLESRRPQ